MLATLSKLDTALGAAAALGGSACVDAGRLVMLLKALAGGALLVFAAMFVLLALALTISSRSPAAPQQPSQCRHRLFEDSRKM